MTRFAIDMAFPANATPWTANQPIALSYAWVVRQDGVWVGKGQRPGGRSERMRVGDELNFTFVDTSGTIDQITGITVTFEAGPTARPGQPESPLETVPDLTLDLAGDYSSAGCNVQGNGASSGPHRIGSQGDWEMTISFKIDGQVFQVDPEMEVIRGG